MKNRCPECRTILIDRVDDTLNYSEDISIPNVSWEQCPKCGERVYSSDVAQKIGEAFWGRKDLMAKDLAALIFPGCLRGHDWPKQYRIKGFKVERHCLRCNMVQYQ